MTFFILCVTKETVWFCNTAGRQHKQILILNKRTNSILKKISLLISPAAYKVTFQLVLVTLSVTILGEVRDTFQELVLGLRRKVTLPRVVSLSSWWCYIYTRRGQWRIWSLISQHLYLSPHPAQTRLKQFQMRWASLVLSTVIEISVSLFLLSILKCTYVIEW